MRRLSLSRRELLLLAGTVPLLRAADRDFWNSKAPSTWTVGDIYRLTNHSPWAKRVEAWRPGTTYSQLKDKIGILPPTGYVYGPASVVTWESAQPLRDAFKTPLPPEFADSYVIGVDGVPTSDIPYLDILSGSTRLRGGGHTKWAAPVSVIREVVRNSPIYLFGFLRTAAPVGRKGEEVTFETRIGEWTIQAKFSPEDMLYHGHIAL